MKTLMLTGILATSLMLGAPVRAGCLGGAIVGGVGGHFVHHPVLGAIGGCAVGHHLAVVKKHQQRLEHQTQTIVTRTQR